VTLPRGAVVDLTLVSGDIIVTAWERPQARVLATSERGIIEFDLSASRLSLDVESRYGHGGDTRYEVTVPVGTRVLTRSVSGDQSVRGVRGPLEVHTVNGDVQVSDVLAFDFETVNGDLRASGLTGEVTGSTVSGDIELSDVTGDIRVESTSGDVALTNVRARVVRAETVSGGIEFSGPLDAAGRYDFTSHSGDVTLAVPADVGAQLGLQTFSGEIRSDFPLVLQPSDDRRRQRRFDVTLGRGGARVSAHTFSGNIDIERGTSPDRDQEKR
jgi:DUF4097 and DUF4098 domain-containing protein YvlB